ncbi:MAG: hypothetical protein L0312_03485, partial [Acidobacteria bacterium]|nr:hypothetical protein [Acidobacteriota bacterium]
LSYHLVIHNSPITEALKASFCQETGRSKTPLAKLDVSTTIRAPAASHWVNTLQVLVVCGSASEFRGIQSPLGSRSNESAFSASAAGGGSAEDLVVLSMGTDPDPVDPIVHFGAQGPLVIADPH